MSDKLEDIAARMVAPGRGILAADESSGTITKRFAEIGIVSTAESRRDYREMLFRSADAMRKRISGVILYDETLRQTAADGTPIPRLIEAMGALPGIKVDTGVKPLAFQPDEKITEGLDGLRERLQEYKALGAKFAKWRAVIDIAPGIPTWNAINANAQALARYAALCQEVGLVPIVEPEVLMDGPVATHDINTCLNVTVWTLKTVFEALFHAKVRLGQMVLKPNMVIGGKNAAKQASPAEVAAKTVQALRECVPPAVPGIAFLSGGQSDLAATEHLSLINQLGPFPWRLTFSYGRALQQAAMSAWAGKAGNVAKGQHALDHRAEMNGLASAGRWTREAEAA